MSISGAFRRVAQFCSKKSADRRSDRETNRVARVRAWNGLRRRCPKGQPDCQWDEDYPAEYAAALDYLNGEHDEQGAFEALSSLVYKIDCEEKRGTPLQSQDRTWSSDDSPTEYHAAKAYMTEQMERVERELLAS